MSIDYLKSFALRVKELLESYTDIIIPVNSSPDPCLFPFPLIR